MLGPYDLAALKAHAGANLDRVVTLKPGAPYRLAQPLAVAGHRLCDDSDPLDAWLASGHGASDQNVAMPFGSVQVLVDVSHDAWAHYTAAKRASIKAKQTSTPVTARMLSTPTKRPVAGTTELSKKMRTAHGASTPQPLLRVLKLSKPSGHALPSAGPLARGAVDSPNSKMVNPKNILRMVDLTLVHLSDFDDLMLATPPSLARIGSDTPLAKRHLTWGITCEELEAAKMGSIEQY